MKNFNHRFLFFIAGVSAMGGLLFGYDWVVIGGAKPFYEQYFGIADSAYLQGWAMACALLGCLGGATLSGMMSEKYGRKRLLLGAAALFFVSSMITGAAGSFTLFVMARLMGGVGIGIASNLSPMYIAEISPTHMRGRLVSLNQLTIVIGILAAQVANWQIAEPVAAGSTGMDILNSWNGQMGWRWMFWAVCVPSFLFFLLTIFIPESPRWLAIRNKEDKAREILSRIGGEEYAKAELKQIHDAEQSFPEAGGLKQLFHPRMWNVLTIGVVLAVLQQWCGINVIFNYAQEIFAAAGYGLSDVLFNIVVTGLANMIFTLLAMYTVDRLGRRALMLMGSGGLTGIFAVMGILYHFSVTGWPLLLLVVIAIGCYAMSLAPVTWVILSEIYPTKIRGAAMAVATFALWSACFILTYTFPLLNKGLGASGTFWLYGFICLSGFLFIRKRLPETKSKSLEELEKELVK
ncbi:sugar porter family MFS transporter [Parabacteroides sp. FAFU027]|uniref:sugar porter family MFS transporter n=1 Tax=Parabacteroides sp. FAFU027 TaxID=2922715 RepID=UPI001FAFF9C3|nr:sugar porter family MFS transporter [Parabacteroides sp. FAFU027]